MMKLRVSRKHILGAILCTAAVMTVTLSYARVFEPYELQTYDWRFQLRGTRPFSKQVCLVDIADDTLKLYGSWPFNREYHAVLAKILKHYGKARATAFDILFSEEAGDADTELGRASRWAGNVYFAIALKDPYFSRQQQLSDGYDVSLSPTLTKYATKVVHINIKADVDGKRRRIPPVILLKNPENKNDPGKPYIQMAVKLAMDALGVKDDELRLEPGRLKLGNKLTIPLDEEQCMLISYAGRWTEVFDHYSYAHVLASAKAMEEGTRPPLDLERKFKDRICIVGFTAAGSVDVDATPLERAYPMVGVHANTLSSILMRDFIHRATRVTNALIALFFGMLVLWVSLTRKIFFAFRVTVLAMLLWIAAAVILFIRFNWWFDIFFPVATMISFSLPSIVARAMQEIRHREVIEKELAIASQIQLSFLPEHPAQAEGLSTDVFMKPAKAVGGDLYHFVTLDDGKLGVMVGDVSGKGTPAALFMAKIVSEFKFSSFNEPSPAAALTRLNDKVSAERTGGLFVTMIYAIFDPKAGRLVFSNGGHLPLVAVSADGTAKQILADGGMPLGVMPGIEFSNSEMQVGPGDCFAFYSDGVSEARNRKADEWGIDALETAVKDFRNLPVDGILKGAVERLNQFMNKADQHDDITLLLVKSVPAGAQPSQS